MILSLSREIDLRLVLMANTKYVAVYRFQTLNRNSIEYARYTNCYRKPNRLLDSEPIGNIFFLHTATFDIPKQRFIIKPPSC